MTIAGQMPLGEVKNRLSEVVDEIEREHGRLVITRYGRPAAVVMSVEDLRSLEETLDVVASGTLPADVREGLDEAAPPVLSKEEALRLATAPR